MKITNRLGTAEVGGSGGVFFWWYPFYWEFQIL